MSETIRHPLCYNEACTKDFANIIGDIDYAAAAGFDLIELRFDCFHAFMEKGGRIDDLRAAIANSGLHLGPMNALYIYPGLPERVPGPKSAEFARDFKTLRLLRDTCGISQAIVVAPLFEDRLKARAYSRAQAFEMSVGALSFLCRELPDVTFAFEPVGLERSLVRDLAFAREIVAATGAKNLGLTVDSCNLFLKEQKSDFDFSQLKPGEIAAVHLMNGVKPDGGGEILDQSWRRFLGDGDWVDTERFMTELHEIGYRGMISTEVFCREYEERYSQRQVIQRAYDTLRAALRSA